MIIKGLRQHTRTGVGRLVRHLRQGSDNEDIAVLRGTFDDVVDMQRDATKRKSTYSVRHWIVAPREVMSRDGLREIIGLLAQEFGFSIGRCVIVEHKKRRSVSDAYDVHWHVLVGEVDPVTGRVMPSSFDFVRHELVARIAEFRLGHACLPGRHSVPVLKALRARGYGDAADRLELVSTGDDVDRQEAFSNNQHQHLKRLGLDLPRLRQSIQTIVAGAQTRAVLVRQLSELGLTVAEGEKRGVWIVLGADGQLIGALHRLAGRKRAEIASLMAAAKSDIVPDLTSANRSAKPTSMREQRGNKTSCLPPSLTEKRPEDVESQLSAAEAGARATIAAECSDFRPNVAMSSAKAALRSAERRLDAAQDAQIDASAALASAPAIRWWHVMLGLAKSRQLRRVELERALSAAKDAVTRASAETQKQNWALYDAEKRAKQEHADAVRDLCKRQAEARRKLDLIVIVRDILTEEPKAAEFGLEELWRKAVGRLARREQEERAIEASHSVAPAPARR